jgi:hypothetical protein
MWNVRSLYRADSLMKEISKYKLDLVRVQWPRTGRQIYIFLRKGNQIHELGTGTWSVQKETELVK